MRPNKGSFGVPRHWLREGRQTASEMPPEWANRVIGDSNNMAHMLESPVLTVSAVDDGIV